MSKKIGQIGEDLACEYLKKENYQIVARNYYSRFGEIDIIAKDGEVVVFVEVKYRKNKGFGAPSEYVTKTKLEKILKTARSFLNENGLGDSDWRIDVCSIDGKSKQIELINNVYLEGFKV